MASNKLPPPHNTMPVYIPLYISCL